MTYTCDAAHRRDRAASLSEWSRVAGVVRHDDTRPSRSDVCHLNRTTCQRWRAGRNVSSCATGGSLRVPRGPRTMQPVLSQLDSLAQRPQGRGPALKHLFARIREASQLAAGAQQLVRLSRSSASLEELQGAVQIDPSLVAQILRRVNSHYYRLDAQVHDVTVAARLLGAEEFANVALTVYLSRMFAPPVAFGTFSMTGLWSHSVAVAAVAQLVARVCGCAHPTEAFSAGAPARHRPAALLPADAKTFHAGGRADRASRDDPHDRTPTLLL